MNSMGLGITVEVILTEVLDIQIVERKFDRLQVLNKLSEVMTLLSFLKTKHMGKSLII